MCGEVSAVWMLLGLALAAAQQAGDSALLSSENSTDTKSTTLAPPVGVIPTSSAGVVRRATIVFSGFAFLGLAYFFFYRSKTRRADVNTAGASTGAGESPGFRYEALGSDGVELLARSDSDDDDELLYTASPQLKISQDRYSAPPEQDRFGSPEQDQLSSLEQVPLHDENATQEGQAPLLDLSPTRI